MAKKNKTKNRIQVNIGFQQIDYNLLTKKYLADMHKCKQISKVPTLVEWARLKLLK